LDKSPGDSLLFKQSALRGVSYALTLKKLLAEAMLDNAMLKDIASKKW
jgi:hypothetical protein